MKKTTRIVSVILVLAMVFAMFIPCAYADDTLLRDDIPTITVRGQGFSLYAEDGTKIYPVTIEDGYIETAAKGLITPLRRGMTLNKWDEWYQGVMKIADDVFGEVALDPTTGEVTDGSHAAGNYVKNRKHSDGRYDINAYSLEYDWRLDPCESAKTLRDYITAVKKATGAKKVNLIGRCIGANVVLAYMAAYDTSDIEKVILVSNGFDGFDFAGALYSGQCVFSAEDLKYFAEDYLNDMPEGENTELYSTLIDLLYVLDATASLGITVKMIDNIYEKVKDLAVPGLCLATFASMPSYWSLVGDDYYEAAKAYMFSDGKDYSVMLAKLDNFHYNVMMKYEEIIENSESLGTEVYIISKYGYQYIPITAEKNVQSDTLLETSSSSFGATCSTVDGFLSDDYIAEAEFLGTDKYISPDKKIDASTCFRPDTTWFIKNMKHLDNPDSIQMLYKQILNKKGVYTVFDDEAYPQYIAYDRNTDTYSPVEEETVSRNLSFFKRYFSFLKKFFALIRTLLGRK